IKNYITNQLLQYNIKNPHLFTISNLYTLKKKQKKNIKKKKYNILQNSKITKFKKSFTSFIIKNLILISIHTLYNTLQ
ncbi:hypothetical protein Q6322_30480, partial [Klebsiella pneumoniae]|uniref:hypothetical protein n=1 Tax=Klebsiella pneumoniae TaxID=573 RepID=UPI0027310A2E